MVHKVICAVGEPRSKARRAHPDAMIIRQIDANTALAFGSVADAFWHPTALVVDGVKRAA